VNAQPAGQLRRGPVRKPHNCESRSHSQPFSRGRKMNQTHFTANPRKRNGTGPHRSDFPHSLAGCWAAWELGPFDIDELDAV
jgi:hypothetical protein